MHSWPRVYCKPFCTGESVETILYPQEADIGSGTQVLSSHFFSEDLLSVTISRIFLSDEGWYTIIASNPAGTDSASVHLTVYGNKPFP